MLPVIVIGDEVTAQGFRLAGAATRVPAEGGVAADLEDALRGARLVLITASSAAEIEPAYLDRVTRAASPLVLVIPDAAMRVTPPNLADAVERVLGIAP